MSFKGVLGGLCALALCLSVSLAHGQQAPRPQAPAPAQAQGQPSPIPGPQDAIQGAGRGTQTRSSDPARDVATFQRGVSMANNAAARLCQAGQQAYCGIGLQVGQPAR